MKTTRLLTSLTFATLVAFTRPANAAPGDLDLAFGTGGKVTTNFGGNPANDAYSVAVQVDGKIVVAGRSNDGNGDDFAMVRYTADGALDASFGTGGKVTTPVGGGNDIGRSVAIQTDGKIVVAGSSNNAFNSDFALVRYNANGSLDTTFNGTGKVTTAVGSGHDVGNSMAIQSDGKIVVAGSSYNDINNVFGLVRYTTSGALDAGFGTGGKVTTSIGSGEDSGNSVAIQSDGKIVVAGSSINVTNRAFALVRYTTSGALDAGFGAGGKVITPIGNINDIGLSVAIQGDGKLVVAGLSYNGTRKVFALVRYTADGALDAGFGTDGKVTTPIGSGDDIGRSVVIQGDGKIVVAGYSYNGIDNDFALVRYNANGSLDTTFNGTGKITTAVGSGTDVGTSVAIQGYGKLVVAGFSYNGANYDFALVRYEGDVDLETFPPTLTAPASGSVSTNSVNVAFFLPEAALHGSVKLTFTGSVTRVLTLTAVNESVGAHAFTFDALNPLQSADIASGPPIPDGTYTVVLSYQDALSHPAAFSAPALNVTVNIDTDGDGILDKYETGTGIYVSPMDTGTNPTNPDTDGDGLTDGQEVNTYHSNPNLHDTDGDGFGDGFEVATGFSPTSAASTPDAVSSIHVAAEYRFNAANGISYRIEASTDLTNWSTIETNIIGTGGVVTRFYSTEGQPKRFFRSRRN